MTECLELLCPAEHCLAIFFFRPEAMTAEQAGLSLAGLANGKAFSDICPQCGQQATQAVQRKHRMLRPIKHWTEIPGVDVPPDTQAVIVVRNTAGNTRVGAVKVRFTPDGSPSHN
jgi:hypothetical protein